MMSQAKNPKADPYLVKAQTAAVLDDTDDGTSEISERATGNTVTV